MLSSKKELNQPFQEFQTIRNPILWEFHNIIAADQRTTE